MMSSREIETKEFEKLLFGKEKIKIEIPKRTDVIIVTTISQANDGSTNVDTITYSSDYIEQNRFKEDKQ